MLLMGGTYGRLLGLLSIWLKKNYTCGEYDDVADQYHDEYMWSLMCVCVRAREEGARGRGRQGRREI